MKDLFYKRVCNFLDEISKETTDLRKVDKFIENGVDINDQSSGNALQIALGMKEKTDRLALVKKLIKKGSEVNSLSSSQMTPLHISCRNPNMELEVVKFLMESGAALNAVDIDGRTCLFWAVQFLSVEFVEYLCKEGCDWHIVDEYGETATFWAAKLQKIMILKYLITQKVDVSSSPSSTSKDLFDLVDRSHREDVVSFFCDIYGRTKFLSDLEETIEDLEDTDRDFKSETRVETRSRKEATDTNSSKMILEEELIILERRLDECDQKEERKIEHLGYTRERCLAFVCERKKLMKEVSTIQSRRAYYEDVAIIAYNTTKSERELLHRNMFPVSSLPKFAEIEKWSEKAGKKPKGDSKLIEVKGEKVVVKSFKPDYLNGEYARNYVNRFLGLTNRHIETPSGAVVNMMSGELLMTKPYHEDCMEGYLSETKESTVLTDLNLILSVAKGLDFLYSHGCYHGNLKVNNIFLDKSKTAILSDYYLPQGSLVGPAKNIPSQLSNSVSEFIPPELYFLDKLGYYESIQKLDIYAFGLMCYCVITKKKEEDLFHRLGKGSGNDLVKFIHENNIRPLLKEFPTELGIEFEEEFDRVIDRAFKELGIDTITEKKMIKNLGPTIERVVKRNFNYQTPPKRMKKLVATFQLEAKKMFKKKMIGKKVKARADVVENFKKNIWAVEWKDYYQKTLKPRILEDYAMTVKKWDLLTTDDLKKFKDTLQELIPLIDLKMLSYFEMFWNDMIYVKNHLKKFPDSFVELMARCWDADPKKRPQSFQVLREDIKNIIMKQITNVKTFSAEQFKNQMKRYEKDRDDIVTKYTKLQDEEVDHYSRFDEYLLRMRAMEDEKKSREIVLKKINDDIEKLNGYSVLLQIEMGKVTMSYTMLMKEKKKYLEEREKLSKMRQGLNEKEKEVKIKIQDMKEKQEMAKMVI